MTRDTTTANRLAKKTIEKQVAERQMSTEWARKKSKRRSIHLESSSLKEE
jgi:hypothetical protein